MNELAHDLEITVSLILESHSFCQLHEWIDRNNYQLYIYIFLILIYINNLPSITIKMHTFLISTIYNDICYTLWHVNREALYLYLENGLPGCFYTYPQLIGAGFGGCWLSICRPCLIRTIFNISRVRVDLGRIHICCTLKTTWTFLADSIWGFSCGNSA